MYFVPPQKWHFQQNGGCVEQRSGDNFINKKVIENWSKGCLTLEMLRDDDLGV